MVRVSYESNEGFAKNDNLELPQEGSSHLVADIFGIRSKHFYCGANIALARTAKREVHEPLVCVMRKQNRLLCGSDSALDWKRLFTCFLGRDYLPSMGILAKLKHSLPTCKFGF